MKKSIIAVCLLTTLPTCKPLACISEGPTHNRYMFSVFHRDALDGPTYLADINSYWIDYCQGKIKQSYYEQFTNSFYANHSEEILKIAQVKGRQRHGDLFETAEPLHQRVRPVHD